MVGKLTSFFNSKGRALLVKSTQLQVLYIPVNKILTKNVNNMS